MNWHVLTAVLIVAACSPFIGLNLALLHDTLNRKHRSIR